LLLEDIRLTGSGGKQVLDELTFLAPQLQAVKIRVRFQKKADNGQELTKDTNHQDPQLCCTRAAQPVKQCETWLGGLDGHNPGLAYQANKGSNKLYYFCLSIVNNLLRHLAKGTYKYADLATDSLIFTGHSFRGTVAVLLHAGGVDRKDILSRLRWKANTFMMYLCDVLPQIPLNYICMFNLVDVESWK
jgi:hypothetical protein